jgi:hypothetical protein
LAAEGSLQGAVQDLVQLQGAQDPAMRSGVQSIMRLVRKLALRDRRDVWARYCLACMEVRQSHERSQH